MKNEMQNLIPRENLDSQVYVKRLRPVMNQEASITDTMASQPLPTNKVNIAVDPLEEEGAIEGLRKSYEDTKILERLTSVEGQLRRLTVYGSIFCLITAALMFGFMLLSISLAKKNFALNGNKSVQTVREIIPSQPTEKGSPSAESAVQLRDSSTGEPQRSPEASPPDKKAAPTPAEDHSTVTVPSQEPTPSAATQETPALPAGPEPANVPNTSKEPTIPGVTYLGSITSNKYHYPECKWAKTIIPKKVRVFHSVAEAQKAGYIRCPVCQPPLTDDPQPPTRNGLPPANVQKIKLGWELDQPRGPGGA
jgi:hypothetical protein